MTSPTMSCRASSPYSHHQPVTRARTAPAPTVAWRKRGARTSTTSLSAYGSAVRRERTVVEDIAGPSWGALRAGERGPAGQVVATTWVRDDRRARRQAQGTTRPWSRARFLVSRTRTMVMPARCRTRRPLSTARRGEQPVAQPLQVARGHARRQQIGLDPAPAPGQPGQHLQHDLGGGGEPGHHGLALGPLTGAVLQ